MGRQSLPQFLGQARGHIQTVPARPGATEHNTKEVTGDYGGKIAVQRTIQANIDATGTVTLSNHHVTGDVSAGNGVVFGPNVTIDGCVTATGPSQLGTDPQSSVEIWGDVRLDGPASAMGNTQIHATLLLSHVDPTQTLSGITCDSGIELTLHDLPEADDPVVLRLADANIYGEVGVTLAPELAKHHSGQTVPVTLDCRGSNMDYYIHFEPPLEGTILQSPGDISPSHGITNGTLVKQ